VPALPPRRHGRPGRRVALALVALVPLLLGVGGGTAHPAGGPVDHLSLTPCPGPTLPTTYAGSVVVAGGSLAANGSAYQTIDYEYRVVDLVVDRATGTILSSTCAPVNGTATSNASGGFWFVANPPTDRCPPIGDEGGDCVEYSGPYGPLSVAPAAPTPAGYSLRVVQNATRFSVQYVALLAGVSIDPTTPTLTVSAGDARRFVATARTGLEAVSPLVVSWNWTVTGAGWSFVGPAPGDNATVRASGTANGTLFASATATIAGAPVTVSSPPIALEAIATTLGGLTLARALVDAGTNVAATVLATAAPGYNYTATVLPGLGLAPVPAPCDLAPAPGGAATVRCSASLTYPATGNATPSANLSNGFSSASGSFAPLTVVPPPALTLAPTALAGYTGRGLPLRVAVAPGTGAAPYQGACLVPGEGPTVCSAGPGPNWTFELSYATAGNFVARASVLDADGVNRSATAPVQIVAPLALGPLSVAGPVSAGAPLELTTTIAGGLLPAAVWWNASTLADPIASEPVGADGPLSVTFVPSTAGEARFTVTVVDQLGTVVERTLSVRVAAGPAATLTPDEVPPASPVTVGTPIAIGWEAFDPAGAPVRNFSVAAELVVERAGSGAAFPAWVNASGAGPLASAGNGTFAVPATAWLAGRINLTVTASAAGPLELVLEATGLPTNATPVDALVLPDLDRVYLHDPIVRESGDRENETFWRVSDRFGDPVVGGFLVVQTVAGGSATDTLAPIVAVGPDASGVWVNFSIPSPGGGTVRVLDGAGDVLLGPFAVPPASPVSPADPSLLALGAAVPIGAAVAGASAVLRRRGAAAGPARPPDDDEGALERLALGRAGVVEIVRRRGAVDLPSLEAAWSPPPAPPDLADWLASLVADGTLGAELGPEGVARFALAAPPVGPPRVTVDVAAFDRAIARRDAERSGERPAGEEP